MKYSMLSIIVLSLAAAVISTSPANAQGKFGIGFGFGEPTGISWKYRINESNAIDGGIGFAPYNDFRFHVDYLWQSYPFHERQLSLYYGVGAIVGSGRDGYYVPYRGGYLFTRDQIGFAARVPVGLAYLIPRSPLDLYFEVAPMVIFTPVSDFSADGDLGIRFYF